MSYHYYDYNLTVYINLPKISFMEFVGMIDVTGRSITPQKKSDL